MPIRNKYHFIADLSVRHSNMKMNGGSPHKKRQLYYTITMIKSLAETRNLTVVKDYEFVDNVIIY